MPLPSILQDHTIKRLIQGAAVGAVVTMIVGFNWGGWSLESTAVIVGNSIRLACEVESDDALG